MAVSAWPDDLPCPMAGRFLPTERRTLSGRPFVARARQRDRHATQEVTFQPTTLEVATALRDYVLNDLEHGGNWFYAAWPIPQGLGGVRRWLAPLDFVNEPGRVGYWRATGVCEIRGAGMLPQTHTPAYWLLNPFVTSGAIVEPTPPWTLSNGDQTVDPIPDSAGGLANHYQGSVYSNLPQSAGKRYFEQVITSLNHDGGGPLDPFDLSPTQFSYGLVDLRDGGWTGAETAFGTAGSWSLNPKGDATFTSVYAGFDAGVTEFLDGPAFAPNSRVMFAVDIEAGRVWIGLDGTWLQGDPGTDSDPIAIPGPGGTFNAGFAAQRAYASSILRTIEADFAHPIPDGFIAWAD